MEKTRMVTQIQNGPDKYHLNKALLETAGNEKRCSIYG
jgi:hypothetical protein